MDRDHLSLVTGYLSVVCWLIVFTPQLCENYRRKSGEGLSMSFLVIWLAGDIFNLLGVIMQNLLVTMFILALYYTVSDICLIWQIIYYRQKLQQQQQQQQQGLIFRTHSETEPLIRRTGSSHGVPSAVYSTHSHSSSYSKIKARVKNDNWLLSWWFGALCGLLMVSITVLSCYAYYSNRHSHEDKNPPSNDEEVEFDIISQVMGWSSAILYVGSRIPQIIKNWRNKSTDGLSIGMFVCAVLGNILFTSSIFLKSTHYSFIIMNLSWIIGSCGTLAFDFIIFVQFFVYNRSNDDKIIV